MHNMICNASLCFMPALLRAAETESTMLRMSALLQKSLLRVPLVPEVEKTDITFVWETHKNSNGLSAGSFGSVSGILVKSYKVRHIRGFDAPLLPALQLQMLFWPVRSMS